MLRPTFPRALRPWACVGLLACSTLSAQAGGVAVGVDLGVPIVTAAGPVGLVSVRGGGGPRGHYRGGYGYGGWGWGWGLGLGLALAAPWVVAQPQVVTVVETVPQPAMVMPAPPMGRPEPVIYPRNGQSAQQTETDRQECNRWATTQPAAMADASVFHRAVEACMDGRGYTLR